MSISPAANFLKPPPVPEKPITARTSGCSLRNSSATASVIGYTVLEPSARTVPAAEVADVVAPTAVGSEQPAIASKSQPSQSASTQKLRGIVSP